MASQDGSLLAGGGASGRVYLWDNSTGELLKEWQAHYKAVSSLSFTTCGSLLASGGLDSIVHCWDVEALVDVSAPGGAVGGRPPSPVSTWSGHSQIITHLLFTPHCGASGCPASSRLVSASLDRTVRWWDIASGRCLHTVTLPTGATALACDTSGCNWFAGGLDGVIYVLGASSKVAKANFSGFHTSAVTSLALSPDSDTLVSGGDDGSARIWSVSTLQQVGMLHANLQGGTSKVVGGSGGGGGGSSSSSSSSKSIGIDASRTSIAGLVILPIRPPTLRGKTGLVVGNGDATTNTTSAWMSLVNSLPTPPPLKKHAALYQGGETAGIMDGNVMDVSSPGFSKVSILRILSTACGEGNFEGGGSVQHCLQQQLGHGAGIPSVLSTPSQSSFNSLPPTSQETELVSLRERVALLESENTRWKAVANKLLEKQREK